MTIDPHPLLDLAALAITFPRPLGEMPTPPEVLALLKADAPAPMRSDDSIRETIRGMLRHGGYKPTGRGKPASEYLLRAAGEGKLSPINLPVDICNAVSLHSGLPISVVDLALATPPLRVGIAAKEKYVFNSAGQEIDVEGLLCLFDAAGPCANAVKDSQRTKTSPATTRVLVCVWGAKALTGRAREAAAWYGSLAASCGGEVNQMLAAGRAPG